MTDKDLNDTALAALTVIANQALGAEEYLPPGQRRLRGPECQARLRRAQAMIEQERAALIGRKPQIEPAEAFALAFVDRSYSGHRKGE